MLREQEVAYILKDCSTRAIVVDHKRLSIVESVRSKVESLRRVILLGKSERDDYVTFNDLLEKVPVAVEFIKEVPRSASGNTTNAAG